MFNIVIAVILFNIITFAILLRCSVSNNLRLNKLQEDYSFNEQKHKAIIESLQREVKKNRQQHNELLERVNDIETLLNS